MATLFLCVFIFFLKVERNFFFPHPNFHFPQQHIKTNGVFFFFFFFNKFPPRLFFRLKKRKRDAQSNFIEMIFFFFFVGWIFMLAQLRYTNIQWRKIFTTSSSLFNGQFCISKNVFFFFFLCVSVTLYGILFSYFVWVSAFIIITPRSIFPYNRKTYWTHRGERKRWSGHIFKQPQKNMKKKKKDRKESISVPYIYFFSYYYRTTQLNNNRSIHLSIYHQLFFILF